MADLDIGRLAKTSYGETQCHWIYPYTGGQWSCMYAEGHKGIHHTANERDEDGMGWSEPELSLEDRVTILENKVTMLLTLHPELWIK